MSEVPLYDGLESALKACNKAQHTGREGIPAFNSPMQSPQGVIPWATGSKVIPRRALPGQGSHIQGYLAHKKTPTPLGPP